MNEATAPITIRRLVGHTGNPSNPPELRCEGGSSPKCGVNSSLVEIALC